MNFRLITIGKTKTPFLLEGIDVYCRRLKRYIPFEIKELPDVKNAGKISEKQQKEAEGDAILSQISESETLILLDERGKEFSSRMFAEEMGNLMSSGKKRINFVIGGPYGFSPAVYDRANSLLSLSKMTFNHEMVRMFFCEQLYRAMTILRGESYHHD